MQTISRPFYANAYPCAATAAPSLNYDTGNAQRSNSAITMGGTFSKVSITIVAFLLLFSSNNPLLA